MEFKNSLVKRLKKLKMKPNKFFFVQPLWQFFRPIISLVLTLVSFLFHKNLHCRLTHWCHKAFTSHSRSKSCLYALRPSKFCHLGWFLWFNCQECFQNHVARALAWNLFRHQQDGANKTPPKDGRISPKKRQPRSVDPSPMKRTPQSTGSVERKGKDYDIVPQTLVIVACRVAEKQVVIK